jgi:hypothetical protein
MKEGILDPTLWRAHFGGNCGLVLRQTTGGMKYNGLLTAHTKHRVIIVIVVIYIIIFQIITTQTKI